MTIGAITINKQGRRMVAHSGRVDVSSGTQRGSCCCCKPYALATFTTDHETWDLTPYQGDGVAAPNRYWRLTNNYTSYVPVKTGCVDADGKLVSLPDSISPTSYKYTWVFRLEIGCKGETGRYIKWQDETQSNIISCDE
ncbi:MAG: hypothetical protein LBT05_14920 [Planctomycetaceae bacterium]|jgi:hypothetical protein|nr:hypothetical protein [Planctomycetaceae bacterium]